MALYYCIWCGRGPLLVDGVRSHRCDKVDTYQADLIGARPGKKRKLTQAEVSLCLQKGKR